MKVLRSIALSNIKNKLKIAQVAFRFWRQALNYARINGLGAAFTLAIRVLTGKELLGAFPIGSLIAPGENLAQDTEILFVSANPRSPSHDYRVANVAEAFKLLGLKVSVIDQDAFQRLATLPTDLVLIWFWRTQISLEVIDRLLASVDSKIHLHYDTDDLTFDSDSYSPEHVPALKALPGRVLTRLLDIDLPAQRLQIANADSASATTFFLAAKMAELAPCAFVFPNTLTKQMAAIAKKSSPSIRPEGFRIVFASGTPTHRSDFLLIWPSLTNFLENHKDASLDLLGCHPISMDEVPFGLVRQIRFLPLVSHDVIVEVLAKYDLSLAPLETHTDFNKAKSAVKILHAAAAGTRSIASFTDETAQTISALSCGECVHELNEWREALESEYKSVEDSHAERKGLILRTLDAYSIESLSVELKQAFDDVLNKA